MKKRKYMRNESWMKERKLHRKDKKLNKLNYGRRWEKMKERLEMRRNEWMGKWKIEIMIEGKRKSTGEIKIKIWKKKWKEST